MAAALIAVVLAVLAGHAAPQLAGVRRFDWFDRWLAWVVARADRVAQTQFGVLLTIAVPVVLVGLLQAALAGRGYGLPGFLFAVLVLFYCWGPRDLDLDVEAVLDAPDREPRLAAAQALLGPSRPATLHGGVLVEGVFRGALERWFAVVLWFLLLGPAGAVLYRLTQLAGEPQRLQPLSPAHAGAVLRLQAILEWPVAQLMVLGLALAANFDAVVGAWRGWYAARGHGPLTLDAGFLGAVARASVDCELIEDEAYDPAEVEAPSPLLELRDAMSLVWRVLMVWLTVLALAVLLGYVN